jgi:hypothetical protein
MSYANLARNIFAHTSLDSSLPPYVSLNEQPDGVITLDVRSRGDQYASRIALGYDQLRSLANSINTFLVGAPR